MMIMQRTLFGIGWLTLGAVLLFFLAGLADGSIHAWNLPHWIGLIALTSLMLWGARALRARGRNGAALALLGVMAVPALVLGTVILIFIINPPRWH
jgi:hypothetical protein